MSAVAETIRSQVGGRAMVMIGATNLLCDETSLQFKIGRNAKGVTHVRIELAADDTYTLTFTSVRKVKWDYQIKELARVEGVYCDGLRTCIEAETSLYTSL